jgi:hypothetical protein
MTSPPVELSRGPAVGRGMERRQRSITSYLLVPRPKDLVKGLLLPVTFVLGLLSIAEITGQSVLRAAVVLAAVELLIYAARYQWNDIRGFAADQAHPSAKDRGRLPGPLSEIRSRVTASCTAIAARLVITALLILLLPGLHLGWILGWATVGVFGVAVVYELLRSVSTGRSGEIPAPLNAGIVALWITVGAGYVVRGLVGLGLAIDLSGRPALAAAATITLWAYGIAFVTSRWALEATAFASSENGRVVWQARADQAREHLLALVRWLPSRIHPHVEVRDWAPLKEWTSLQAPWNVAMLVAGGAAAVTGRLLCGPCPPLPGVVSAIVGVLATVAVTSAPRWRPGCVLLGAVALLMSLVLTGSPRPLLAVLPWLLISAAYLFFTTRTPRRLAEHSQLSTALKAFGAAIGRLIVGDATWDALRAHSSGAPM